MGIVIPCSFFYKKTYMYDVYVVVQFYPCFNFDFPLFDIHYHIYGHRKEQGNIKIEPRIKLNYNDYNIYIKSHTNPCNSLRTVRKP